MCSGDLQRLPGFEGFEGDQRNSGFEHSIARTACVAWHMNTALQGLHVAWRAVTSACTLHALFSAAPALCSSGL